MTTREVEILKSIAEGLSIKEIGERLFIGLRTVDTHRNNMMKKLGVNKIAGLIRLAYKYGLVGQESCKMGRFRGVGWFLEKLVN